MKENGPIPYLPLFGFQKKKIIKITVVRFDRSPYYESTSLRKPWTVRYCKMIKITQTTSKFLADCILIFYAQADKISILHQTIIFINCDLSALLNTCQYLLEANISGKHVNLKCLFVCWRQEVPFLWLPDCNKLWSPSSLVSWAWGNRWGF